MYAWIPKTLPALGTIFPCLWGFAAAAAVGYPIDVQSILPEVLAVAIIAGIGPIVVRGQRK